MRTVRKQKEGYMHLYVVNGLLAMVALIVTGYFIVALARSAWHSTGLAQFFLLVAEGILALTIFGIVDYAGGYPPLWFAIILLFLVRAVSLHLRLTVPLKESANPFDYTI